ncbi:MAG: RimK/LysX family protein [Candidatus Saccharimonadales bacterium]
MSKYPVVIGRFEHIDLVGILEAIPAKIDTGAYRSSIHATDIKVVEKNGKMVLRFTLLGHPAHQKHRTIEVRTYKTRQVKSSNGHISSRYEVNLKIRLGYKIFITPFTLSDRGSNIFPVLIGRKALNKRFLVDSDKTGVNRMELRLAAASVPFDEEDLEGVNA